MEHRCVLCNEIISEDQINEAIAGAYWEEFGPWNCDEEGVPQQPDGTNFGVSWSHRWGCVHLDCELNYGTGRTRFEWATQMLESMRDIF
jgi:hypothetical protein